MISLRNFILGIITWVTILYFLQILFDLFHENGIHYNLQKHINDQALFPIYFDNSQVYRAGPQTNSSTASFYLESSLVHETDNSSMIVTSNKQRSNSSNSNRNTNNVDCKHDVSEVNFHINNKTKKPKTILILGSGGLVGSALVKRLKYLGLDVIEVQNRYDMDLRHQDALDPLLQTKQIDFCFFLACEVGGSKFLSQGLMQQLVDLYSEKMQQAVIHSLAKYNVPFLFASSQLVVNNKSTSQYGEVKKRGEILTLQNGGKIFRIWNAFGPEAIGFKSHVVSDWIYTCLKRGLVYSATNGWETRQFVHVDNMAMALVAMMHQFNELPDATDMASDQPITMRKLADEISHLIPGGCKFVFSTQESFYPSSATPSSLFKVPGSLRCGLNRLVEYYQKVHARRNNGEVYLSIITSSTNDDYNGIRSRLFTFLHFLGEQLSKTSLLYEVVLVQYNPTLSQNYFEGNYDENTARYKDLPLSQLVPLTAGTVNLSPLRIVTVPSELHRFDDKGRFWEYIAKNVGARVARGKFLLFTNVDNLWPTTLVAWLSKEQLLPNRWYRAGMLQNEYRDQVTCDLVGTGHAACHKHGICLPGFQEKTGNGYCDACLGDFSIFSREAFYATGGYAEIPQNTHVETAHMYFAESLPTFQSIRSVWMDETLCHRDHTRNDRPAVPLGIDGIAEQMRARPDNAEWGLVSHLSKCPEAALLNSSIFSWGYNPEQPFLLRDHHPLFQELFPVVIQAPFDKEYHLDFAGTKTKYEYDCTNWFRYRRYHLSRRIVCDRMDVFSAYGLGTNFAHIPVYGDLPVIDEEYFEWLSLLKALQAWRTESRPFVIAEFGARYGTWAARGAVMARRIHPDLGAHVCAIEGDSVGFAWLQDHMRVNGLYENATLVRGMVGNANDTQIAVQWEPGSTPDAVPVYVVQDLLKTYPVVDIVHIDIQGAETALLDKDVRMFLKKQVRFLHIGTHGNQILHDLKAAYVHDDGWMLLHEFQQGTKILTEMGPITLNADGELAIRNINLVA